jgi:5-(carboxyamino)imidazole ribonucleotide synthase
VAFDREVSVVAARGVDGTVRTWPLVENHHAEGILRTAIAPAPGDTPVLEAEAEAIARAWLERFGYVGVVAIELFQVGDLLLANEVAPRVHNSGHWTIEGAVTSQFEQHLRAITGLPLGDTGLVGPSATVNVIGALPDPATVLAVPGAHLHLYAKAPRPARKIGHVTVVGTTVAERDERLARVGEALAGAR